jgi:hypothetical protein
MARNRKKISLYEVIGKNQLKSGYNKVLEQQRAKSAGEGEAKPIDQTADVQVFDKTGIWPKKPRVVQFNTGRVEMSIPYQLAIALLLGLVLLVMVAFRLGQISYSGRPKTSELVVEPPTVPQTSQQQASGPVQIPDLAKKTEKIVPVLENVEPVAPEGDNVIVLVEYQAQADLIPVRDHFAQYGIETEIIRENGRYFLVTKDRYENPAKPGTDGYKAKQRIVEVGAMYAGKAPAGYETFAPNFFADAYGKKIR